MMRILVILSLILNAVLLFSIVSRTNNNEQPGNSTSEENSTRRIPPPNDFAINHGRPGYDSPGRNGAGYYVKKKKTPKAISLPWELARQIVSIDAFHDDGQLSDNIITLLGLTKQEIAQIESSLAKIQADIVLKEQRDSSLITDEFGVTWVELPANYFDILEFEKQAKAAFFQIIGESKANILKYYLQRNHAFFEYRLSVTQVWLSTPDDEDHPTGIVLGLDNGKIHSTEEYWDGSVPFHRYKHLFSFDQ